MVRQIKISIRNKTVAQGSKETKHMKMHQPEAGKQTATIGKEQFKLISNSFFFSQMIIQTLFDFFLLEMFLIDLNGI